jgi:Uma2 family endonuclease
MSQSVATPPTLLPTTWTVADLRDHLGGIPLVRIRLYPFPGAATEKDVLDINAREDRLCELVDGVLVEKTMGYYESRVALVIAYFLEGFLESHDLGIVLGADGMLRLAPRQVRIPDVSFLSWAHFPERVLPAEPIPDLVPDLAVEVLSEGNTRAEVDRKLREDLGAGVRVVWYVDPEARTATVFTAVDQGRTLTENEALDGGEMLPGLRLPLHDVFARAGRRETP